VRVDRDHGARHLRCDLHEVAPDVGVVGRLVIAAVQQPPGAVAEPTEQKERHHAEQQDGPLLHFVATCKSNPPPKARTRLMESASSRACSSEPSERCSSTAVSAVSTCSRLPMPAR